MQFPSSVFSSIVCLKLKDKLFIFIKLLIISSFAEAYKGSIKFNKKKNINCMNKIEIKDFISYYEKITKWMMKNTLSNSNLIIKINKNQKIQSIST